MLPALFKRFTFASDVIRHLQADTKLDPNLRKAALRFVQTHGDSPPRLNMDSRKIVSSPTRNCRTYRRALQMAEVANRLTPRNPSIMNTLGIAQYRIGAYADALATFIHCQELSTSPDPTDLVFITMAHFKLGAADRARLELEQLHALIKDPRTSPKPEFLAYLREAELLIGRR